MPKKVTKKFGTEIVDVNLTRVLMQEVGSTNLRGLGPATQSIIAAGKLKRSAEKNKLL